MVNYQENRALYSHRLSRSAVEIRYVAAVTSILLLVTSIPVIFGYVITPEGMWFSGIVDNVHDTSQYLSWMNEAGQRLFTENKLTAEPSRAIFLNLHWWILGRLASLLGISIFLMYQLFRIFAICLLVVSSYLFFSLIFDDQTRRRFAFVLSLLTSGLGWVWIVNKQITGDLNFPLDVHTTLGNAFYTMTSSPHLAFSAAMTILVMLVVLWGFLRRSIRISIAAGLLALFLGAGHIYDLVLVWSVLAVFGALVTLRDGFSWRVFWSLFGVVLISSPAALYWGWVSSDPIWKQALSQYDNLGVFTPDPLHLLILLGLTFLVALATFSGVVPLYRQSHKQLFIKCWFGITLLLIYLPLPFQIMLLTGYQIPLAALATIGLFDHILPWLWERMPATRLGRWFSGLKISWLLPVLFLLAVLPTNLYLLGWRLVVLNRHEYPIYLYQDDLSAMKWLREETSADEVVLSSFSIGHYLAGVAGNKAFLANAVMTLDFYKKEALVNEFYRGETSDTERQRLVRDYGIHYVYYGEAEKGIGDFDPGASQLFSEVFSSPRVKVFEVNGSR